MKEQHQIAVLSEDGIGPEVMDDTLLVVDRIVSRCDLQVDWRRCPAAAQLSRDTGVALPAATIRRCLDSDAVFLAIVGLRRELRLDSAVWPVKLHRRSPPGPDQAHPAAHAAVRFASGTCESNVSFEIRRVPGDKVRSHFVREIFQF